MFSNLVSDFHLILFSISLISCGVVFLNRRVIIVVKVTDAKIAMIGWMVLPPHKIAYPRRIPAKVAIVLLATYLLTGPLDQINEGIEEVMYATKIETAEPKIP